MNDIIGFIVGAGIVLGFLSFIWYIIKRMVYSLVYVSKKAIEDAKSKQED